MVPIIKVVSIKCNLRCGYCFYHKDDQKQKQSGDCLMSDNILENLINEVCSGMQFAQFIWHGGEPLLAGIDFFRKVVALQERYKKSGQKIINKLQTNGTLINNKWANFFADNNFGIGVSIDGPRDLHNYFRKFTNGKGSFDATLRGIRILQQKGIQPGVIAVINSQNSKKPREMFDFFTNLGLKKIAFNHASGKNYNPKALQSNVSPLDYAEFIKKVFDFWIAKNDPEIEIRQIKSILQGLLGGKYRSCEFNQGCSEYFTVEYNGNIYPCDCSDPDEKIYFGNIKKGLRQIFSSEAYNDYQNKIREARLHCTKCRWYEICKGGCVRDYYSELSDNPKNYFCDGLKKVYQYIYGRLNSYKILTL